MHVGQKCLINFDVFLQYCMNAALERTSVSSTTILFSTSGIFTLLISVSMGQDSINAVNLVSVCQHGWCCHDNIRQDLGYS